MLLHKVDLYISSIYSSRVQTPLFMISCGTPSIIIKCGNGRRGYRRNKKKKKNHPEYPILKTSPDIKRSENLPRGAHAQAPLGYFPHVPSPKITLLSQLDTFSRRPRSKLPSIQIAFVVSKRAEQLCRKPICNAAKNVVSVTLSLVQ